MEPNPLDGTWVSEPLTRADVRRAARLAGDASDAAAMLADLPPTPFRVALYVSGDRSSMHAVFRVDGRTEENADEENVTVSGDRVVMQPMFADGENVHTCVLDDGTLRFAFVSTTEGETDGVPGEAWQRLSTTPRSSRPGREGREDSVSGRGLRPRVPPETVSSPNAEPTPLPSRRTVSSSGLPDPAARWPLNSTTAAVGQPPGLRRRSRPRRPAT